MGHNGARENRVKCHICAALVTCRTFVHTLALISKAFLQIDHFQAFTVVTAGSSKPAALETGTSQVLYTNDSSRDCIAGSSDFKARRDHSDHLG